MTQPNTHPTLSVSIVERLLRVFKELKWNINSEVEGAHPYEEVFNDFAELLAYLEDEEQDLILKLTENYLHCTSLQYSILLKQALSKVPRSAVAACEAVFLLPLKAPKDKGKIKSSDGMLYSARLAIPQILGIHDKPFYKHNDADVLKEKYSGRKRAMILLVDDFIGSGDTAESALIDYNQRLKVDDDLAMVVALVAQEQGISKLSDLGFHIVAARVRKQGITDNIAITNKPRAIELMKKIERQIGVSAVYSLGYGRSEALVSMLRTPNNTFPIFWWPSMPKERLRSTPFKREAV